MNFAGIYEDLIYNEERPMIKVLFETTFTKEIRIAMKKGTVMREHSTSFPIVVNIVEGAIDFGVNREVQHLKRGNLIALEGNIPHDLKALEDSIVRLTLTKSDDTNHVKNLSK